MSKELDAFEQIKKYLVNLHFHFLEEELDIIETALKENIGLRKANEFLIEDCQKLEERINDLERIIKEPDTTIKKLKALEIIKKRFTIQFCKSDLNGYYGIIQIGINPIYIKTKEEYDLLKEVLS